MMHENDMLRKQKMLRRFIPHVTLIGFVLLLILSACSSGTPAQTPEPGFAPAQNVTPSPTTTENETPVPMATPLLGELIATRVPEPTAAPGPLDQRVMNFAARTGLVTTKFLGLRVADWINLAISLVYILIGYTLGTWLIRYLLPKLARRTPTMFDNELLQTVGPDIRWLVVVFITSFSTNRLTFFNASLKTFLKDIYFVLGLYLIVRIIWNLVELALEWYQEHSIQQEQRDELAPILLIVNRLSRAVIIFVGITILLAHFGINVTALTAALGIGGLALSLAARDTIADAIAGVIILIDRPFRIGDRIEIQGVGTWGDVTDIGLRTTRIRTRDNRMVIVPNSIISQNQVINYSFPDPRYRIETYVDIAFGTDIETVRRLLLDTLRQVEGVLLDKPVDVLYDDMSGAAMRFRLRWWIESYADKRRMFDRVHTAIQHALDSAGIVSPNISDNISLLVDQETSDRLSRAFRSHRIGSGQGDDDATSTGMKQYE